MLERHGFVGAAGKLDQVHAGFFELLAEDLAFVAGETAFREAASGVSGGVEGGGEGTYSELLSFILRMNLDVSTRFLISSMIRKTIRLLFSREPPYLSVRLLTREDRNCGEGFVRYGERGYER